MKCSKCGKEVDPKSEVCPYCGEKLKKEEMPVWLDDVIKSIREENNEVKEKPQKDEDYKSFIFRLLAHLSIVGGICLGFFGLVAGCVGLLSEISYPQAKAFRFRYILGVFLGLVWIAVIIWTIVTNV